MKFAGTLLAQPLVYDAIQWAAGAPRCFAELGRSLPPTSGWRVLDVGAGTGGAASAVRSARDYLPVDVDLQRLLRCRRRVSMSKPVAADAAGLPFVERSVDLAICAFVFHHLDEASLGKLLRELGRVCRFGIAFVEPLAVRRRVLSTAMWSIDRGCFPRTRGQLLESLGREFELDAVREFSVFHRYLVGVGRLRQ